MEVIKTKEAIEREWRIVSLLGELNDQDRIKAKKALESLLAIPKEYFLSQDLQRLIFSGNENYKNFAELFLQKNP